jgi:maltose alpha-D-glucosyltransferase / alpha-amylase
MQWDDGTAGGFTGTPDQGLAPLATTGGRYGSRRVNVRAQQREPDSLLRWFQQLIATLRECPEVGTGNGTVLDLPLPRSVLAHRFDAPEGSMLFLHNLADQAVTVDIGRLGATSDRPFEMFADGPYDPPTARLSGLELRGWGYRWLRLRRSNGT